MGIYSIQIQNFKSIRDSGEVLIQPINIFIGANGVGKSNFIGFFKFLNKLFEQQLQLYMAQNGRADNFLFFGRKHSKYLWGKIIFDNDWYNEYEFRLLPDQSGNLLFSHEWNNYTDDFGNISKKQIGGQGTTESVLKLDNTYRNKYLIREFDSLKIFHFHDTGADSKMKGPCNTRDYAFLREDGGNIAAFLYRLQESAPKAFEFIEYIIQSIAPFFDRFYLQPDEINPEQIFLRWYEKGYNELFTAHNLSDGTLRMICLSALLLQPDLPGVIIIDEPELGLHPFAINKLAGMLQSASTQSQIIVSTQSVTLLNQFTPDDIIVMDRVLDRSTKLYETKLNRLSEEKLKTWLEEYTIGELWEKNVLGGRPK